MLLSVLWGKIHWLASKKTYRNDGGFDGDFFKFNLSSTIDDCSLYEILKFGKKVSNISVLNSDRFLSEICKFFNVSSEFIASILWPFNF